MNQNKSAANTAAQSETTQSTTPDQIVALIIGKDGKTVAAQWAIDVLQPSKSIGDRLKVDSSAFQFSFNGLLITVPAMSAKVDNKGRYLRVADQVLKAIFKGKENDEQPDQKFVPLVQAFGKAGFHYENLTKLQVLRGAEIKVKHFFADQRFNRSATDNIKENKIMLLETGTANKLNRIIKTDGLPAAMAAVKEMKTEAQKEVATNMIERVFSSAKLIGN